MSLKKKPDQNNTLATIITLTLSEEVGDKQTGTLLIQRGDLAQMRQFVYTPETDFTAVIRQALDALAAIESDPPVIPDAPPEKAAAQAAPPEPETLAEPMVDIPTKKSKVAIPIRFLKIADVETDTEVYQQAVLTAGRLIDGKLWDGRTPICITDVEAAQHKLKHLSDKEMSLFTLEDFAQRVTDAEPDAVEEVTHDSPDATSEDDLPSDKPDNDPAPASKEAGDDWIAEHAVPPPTLPDNTAQPDLL